MKIQLRNWNVFRIIRLILGIVVIVQGITSKEALFALAGGILALTALANIGCCGANGCAVRTQQNHRKTENKIIYEEVDSTK